jgi:ribosomal protein S18 acetylase RimI-like enzyme
MDEPLRIIEITSLNDDLLPAWLDLYETAFPANERVLVSTFFAILKSKAKGKAEYQHLLAAVDKAGELVGMVWYELFPETEAAALWCIAVAPEARSRGAGSWLYKQVIARADPKHYAAWVFEVEKPENAAAPEQEQLARRRIGFYRRNGARLLTEIRYIQTIGTHQTPITMHLMIHSLRQVDARQAFDLAAGIFGSAVVKVGKPELV